MLQARTTRFSGVWLPSVTPFVEGEVDYASYERLVDHYIRAGIAGLIPLDTTGESPTVDEEEAEALIERTVAAVAGRVPIMVGAGGNDTRKVVRAVKRLERHAVQGILSVCPYYNRPSQDGLREHFTRVAEATARPILIYNIPYRTGVNLTNETLLALAELPNIVGVKDSSGNLAQSLDLLRQRPAGFAVLTGDDANFFTTLAHGGDGGILASAHVDTGRFLDVYARMAANDHVGARAAWRRLEPLVEVLFKEPNPMPIKRCLWRQGLIRSAECRLPLTGVSEELGRELDRVVDGVGDLDTLTSLPGANILARVLGSGRSERDEAMRMSDWSEVTRPIPVPNEWTKPFWEAARRGVLALQRCQACGHFQHPPYATCVRCMAIDLAFEPVSGRGAIYAYTIMYHAGDRRFAPAVPYASIVVELDDAPGALLAANLLEVPYTEAKVGRRVEVIFEPLNDDITLPQFRLARDAA